MIRIYWLYGIAAAIHAETSWLKLILLGVHMMGEKDISYKIRTGSLLVIYMRGPPVF